MSIATVTKLEAACPACKGQRYVLDRKGERSSARVCACNERCALCDGTGTSFVEQGGYRYARSCVCRTVAARVSRFNHARLPARAGLTFDEFEPGNEAQQNALHAAEAIARMYRPDQPKKGLAISGPVGTGKTHLLCATLAYIALEQGARARYVEVSFLYSEIRNGFKDGKSGLEAIQPLIDVDVLAIDELGKGRGSPFELDTLDELIARRYNANRTTLVATNYSLEAERVNPGRFRDMREEARAAEPPASQTPLRERVGERVYSRLAEMCTFVTFPPTTRDHRRPTT